MPIFGNTSDDFKNADPDSEKYFSARTFLSDRVVEDDEIKQTVFCMMDVEWPTTDTYHYFSVTNDFVNDRDIVTFCTQAKAGGFSGLTKHSGLSFWIPGVKLPTRIVWYSFVRFEEFHFGHTQSSLFLKYGDRASQLGNYTELTDNDGNDTIIRLDHKASRKHTYHYGLNLISGADTLKIDPSIHNDG